MYILLVENDSNQREMLEQSLTKAFPDIQVKPIRTELEFQNNMENIKNSPPVVIIMDVMMQWTKVSENITAPPPEVEEQGARRAGIRCAKLLAKDPKTQTIPVILYTVLGRTDLEKDLQELPPTVIFLQKKAEEEPLLNQIRKFIGAQ